MANKLNIKGINHAREYWDNNKTKSSPHDSAFHNAYDHAFYNAYYSVSISGTWNGLGDNNSGMVYSVENKTTNDFIITQRLGDSIQDGDSTNQGLVSTTEVSVSY